MAIRRNVTNPAGAPPAPPPTTGPTPSPTTAPTTAPASATIPPVTHQTFTVDTMHCPSITGPVTVANLHTGGPAAPVPPAGPPPWWHDRRFAWGTIVGALLLLFVLALILKCIDCTSKNATSEEPEPKEEVVAKKKVPTKKEPPAKKETEKKSPATKKSTGDTKPTWSPPADSLRESQQAEMRWDEAARKEHLNKLCLDDRQTRQVHDAPRRDHSSSRYCPEADVEIRVEVRINGIEQNQCTCSCDRCCNRYCSPNRCCCPRPDTRSRPNTREPDYRGQVYVQR